jgi:hypothetical protein
MSSLRKIDANRENGKLGGPKTPEGKAIASLNAIRHGLAGNTLVLTNESRPMYNSLLESFVERFKPADDVELDLVLEMVNNRWRLRRIWSVETALLDLEMDDQEDDIAKDRGDIDEVVRIALAFKSLAENKGLGLLNRYEARLRRQYEHALANLRTLQSDRQPPDGHGPAAQQNQSTAPASEPPVESDQTNPPAPDQAPSASINVTNRPHRIFSLGFSGRELDNDTNRFTATCPHSSEVSPQYEED